MVRAARDSLQRRLARILPLGLSHMAANRADQKVPRPSVHGSWYERWTGSGSSRDSLLEGTGFELRVPLPEKRVPTRITASQGLALVGKREWHRPGEGPQVRIRLPRAASQQRTVPPRWPELEHRDRVYQFRARQKGLPLVRSHHSANLDFAEQAQATGVTSARLGYATESINEPGRRQSAQIPHHQGWLS
jgi:hypothetical protein